MEVLVYEMLSSRLLQRAVATFDQNFQKPTETASLLVLETFSGISPRFRFHFPSASRS